MPNYLSPGVYVEEVPSAIKPIAGVGTSTAGFIGLVPDRIQIPCPKKEETVSEGSWKEAGAKAEPSKASGVKGEESTESGSAKKGGKGNPEPTVATVVGESFSVPTPAGQVRLVTNFSEFQKHFGDFSLDPGQRNLAHAVYGFFNNGGRRCFVVREKNEAQIASSALKKFEAIDEIALVCAPGLTDNSIRDAIVTHCQTMGDRFAILDGPEEVGRGDLDLRLLSPDAKDHVLPTYSDYAAFYFPWIRIFDPATKVNGPCGDVRQYVPPSGHVAGIYARVDTERGVHKAPANEVIRGALGLKYYISKAQQDGLNPHGVNCLRDINGSHRVWGARTIGGDQNGEWKYVNVRRLFLYLRESIDEGTQWVVFEPNAPSLWGKIRRNVSAFLTNVWREGALFGTTADQAFYVKCDEETNPPEVRDQGQVVIEVGVAVAKPAEFVIFRISQWGGPKGS